MNSPQNDTILDELKFDLSLQEISSPGLSKSKDNGKEEPSSESNPAYQVGDSDSEEEEMKEESPGKTKE